jgi:hypothetical protein
MAADEPWSRGDVIALCAVVFGLFGTAAGSAVTVLTPEIRSTLGLTGSEMRHDGPMARPRTEAVADALTRKEEAQRELEQAKAHRRQAEQRAAEPQGQ